MHFVEFDKSKNILRFTLELKIDEEDAKQCLKKIENCLHKLKSGLRILTDMRNVETISPLAAPYIGQIMDRCNKKGVSKIIRVIPDPSKDLGLNIMSKFHYSKNVQIITCSTMVEALNKLFSNQECG